MISIFGREALEVERLDLISTSVSSGFWEGPKIIGSVNPPHWRTQPETLVDKVVGREFDERVTPVMFIIVVMIHGARV